ncbi:hypothetical protein B0H12DRAFT_1239606 [Mycena haematopus]|nr:hypothetical protein B0H12DRAFT_1239606 [Mycena haematopus]
MVQNPRLFAEYTTNAQKHKTLTRHGKHEKAMKSFLRNEREPLSRTRNQVYNFARVQLFIPPPPWTHSGATPVLSLVSQRLHNALEDRADLRLEIKARAAGILKSFLNWCVGSSSARTKTMFATLLSAFIALNAAKFLDHEWVDIALLKEYLQHTNQIPPFQTQFASKSKLRSHLSLSKQSPR